MVFLSSALEQFGLQLWHLVCDLTHVESQAQPIVHSGPKITMLRVPNMKMSKLLAAADGNEADLTVYGDVYIRPQPPSTANSTAQQRRKLQQSGQPCSVLSCYNAVMSCRSASLHTASMILIRPRLPHDSLNAAMHQHRPTV